MSYTKENVSGILGSCSRSEDGKHKVSTHSREIWEGDQFAGHHYINTCTNCHKVGVVEDDYSEGQTVETSHPTFND